MPARFPAFALKKEFRALAPAWLGCLAIFTVSAALMAPGRSQALRVVVYVIGAIALGALSMGHEYSGGTLPLLLSQPRRRGNIWLLKLGVLGSLLLVLSGVEFALGVGGTYSEGLLLAVPLLCGLFIAPFFTMLCRNPLAGMVFTAVVPGLVALAGEIAAAMKFGMLGPTLAADANALKTAILWRGMFAVSGLAAIAGWQMFMRLEAIDGRGQAVRLPWQRALVTGTTPLVVKRHRVWLLIKKELRLQQLSFVVAGLYALGWFGVWSIRSAIPSVELSDVILPAATVLTILMMPLLVGSLASAEERQLGTIEWQALLPMQSRTQWWIKVAVTVGVAVLLGVVLPFALPVATPSLEVRTGVMRFPWGGICCAVIFISVMSVYVSSLCTNAAQALLWSAVTGFGLMTFANSSLLRRLVGRSAINPIESLRFLTLFEHEPYDRPDILWAVMSALVFLLYIGELGFLIRFARANHRSSERSSRRLSRQLISLAAFLGIVLILWNGVSYRYRVEAEAYSRDYMKRTFGFVTVSAVDNRNKPATSYTVVFFPEDAKRSKSLVFMVDPARWPRNGRLEDRMLPGRYSVVAVAHMGWEYELPGRRDPEVLARLKAHAIPFTLAAGESKTLTLPISPY
jgi:hypothetical protein